MASALVDIYPSIGLDKKKITPISMCISLPLLFFSYSALLSHLSLLPFLLITLLGKEYWSYAINRRYFFDTYAKANNFDPLFPINWYNVTYDSLATRKVTSSPSPFSLFCCSSFFFLYICYWILTLYVGVFLHSGLS